MSLLAPPHKVGQKRWVVEELLLPDAATLAFRNTSRKVNLRLKSLLDAKNRSSIDGSVMQPSILALERGALALRVIKKI
jgi:hypothetical protein